MRSDIHIKVVVEHEADEKADKLAAEICRAVQKIYGVRSCTVSNIVDHEQ